MEFKVIQIKGKRSACQAFFWPKLETSELQMHLACATLGLLTGLDRHLETTKIFFFYTLWRSSFRWTSAEQGLFLTAVLKGHQVEWLTFTFPSWLSVILTIKPMRIVIYHIWNGNRTILRGKSFLTSKQHSQCRHVFQCFITCLWRVNDIKV